MRKREDAVRDDAQCKSELRRPGIAETLRQRTHHYRERDGADRAGDCKQPARLLGAEESSIA